MLGTLQKLTPETLEAFMKKLHEDPALKLDVITGLTERGLVATLEQYFQLSEQQRKLLEQLQAQKGALKIWEQIISGTLMAGGNVVLVQRTDGINGGQEMAEVHGSGSIHVGTDGVSVNASVECLV